jgi:hypothetical protein
MTPRRRPGTWTRLGVTWLTELEYRRPEEAWFGTVINPDGNYVQIIELTEAYWAV